MLKLMMRQAWFAIVLLGFTVSCGSDEDSANLSIGVEESTLTFAPAQLGGLLSGNFKLRIALGEYAPSAVLLPSAPSFKLMDSKGEAVIDPLSVKSTIGSFPLELQPGDSEIVLCELSSSQLLSDEEGGKVCGGRVRISGLSSDDEQQPTSFSSAQLEVECGQ
jgi:hypothetical protein